MMDPGPSQGSAQPSSTIDAQLRMNDTLYSHLQKEVSPTFAPLVPFLSVAVPPRRPPGLSCCPDMELRLPLLTTTEHPCVDPTIW
jgi:hypothetical protein